MDTERAEEIASEDSAPVWEPIATTASHLSYWVTRTERGFKKHFARVLAECGIIASEWAALRALYQPQRQSPMELGRVLDMSRGGASKLVTRLVKKGLVSKLTAKFDRRFRSIGLTRQGRDFVVRLATLEKEADREFSRPFGNGRRFLLIQWMTRATDTQHSQRMRQWVSGKLKQEGLTRVDPDAQAKAQAKAQAEADEFWDYIKRVGEAAAYGRPPPSPP